MKDTGEVHRKFSCVNSDTSVILILAVHFPAEVNTGHRWPNGSLSIWSYQKMTVKKIVWAVVLLILTLRKMTSQACEPNKQEGADQWMSALIIYWKMGYMHIVEQLQHRHHARNIKAVIKYCTNETSLLSQTYLLLQPLVNELLQQQLWTGHSKQMTMK